MSEKSAEKGEMGRVRTATSYATGEAKNIDDDARKLEGMSKCKMARRREIKY
jgi:hypothetical protein